MSFLRKAPVAVENLNTQTTSTFFTLPNYIRRRIYQDLLGNNLIHILRRNHKLGHKVCKINGDPENCRVLQCRGFKNPFGFHTSMEFPIAVNNGVFVQILHTCKLVYLETIGILYSDNIFNFDSMEGLILFSSTIAARSLDGIRILQLDFRFDLSPLYHESDPQRDWPRWERTWRIIASMIALEDIRLLFAFQNKWKDENREARMLELLEQVTGIKRFEVTMPYLRMHNLRERSGVPFQILPDKKGH